MEVFLVLVGVVVGTAFGAGVIVLLLGPSQQVPPPSKGSVLWTLGPVQPK